MVTESAWLSARHLVMGGLRVSSKLAQSRAPPTSPHRGEKYGFITYRCSEHAALSLRNGAALRKRNEPSFQLSYGGLQHFCWPRHTDYGKYQGPATLQRDLKPPLDPAPTLKL